MKFNMKLGLRSFVAMCGLASLCAFTSSLAQPPERSPQDRSAPNKDGLKEAQASESTDRPLSTRPVSIGYYMNNLGNVTGLTVIVGKEEIGVIKYTLGSVVDKNAVPISDSPATIKPETFVRMDGTARGMAAIANALGGMLTSQPPAISKVEAPNKPNSARVEAVGFFEDANVVHVLTVRFNGEEPMFEEIGFVASGCSATVPGHTCGCSASGSGSSCKAGTYANGTNWAKCSDGGGTTNCTGSGGACTCAD